MNSPHLLVIGGTGFIGHHLLRASHQRDWKMTSVSLNPPPKERFVDDVCYLNFDITDSSLVKKYLDKDFDYVVNLGGHVDHSNTKKTFRSHFIGLKNLTEIFENNKPKLFYDKSSGGMRECLHNPGITGVCTAFKLFDSTSYDKDTLFYNKQTGAMQPCMGLVTLIGECTAFGLYRSSLASKDQLFYDPSSNKMTTCNHVGIDGKCHMYDIIPRTGSTGGSYRIDSKSNPYYKKVPQTPGALIQSGMDMITGRCTLGLNC